jgi:hypothetical protein
MWLSIRCVNAAMVKIWTGEEEAPPEKIHSGGGGARGW